MRRQAADQVLEELKVLDNKLKDQSAQPVWEGGDDESDNSDGSERVKMISLTPSTVPRGIP